MSRGRLESIELDTPTGSFVLTFEGPQLIATGWPALGASVEAPSTSHARTRRLIQVRFEAYFEGDFSRASLGDFETPAGTSFQHACWTEARTIPIAGSRTYGWIAERIGRPAAARAVGQAMRANPMPIVVPCHRVIGRVPGSGGFSGSTGRSSGMRIKRKLLELEQPS